MDYKLKCYAGDEPRIPVTAEFVEQNHLVINELTAKDIMNRNSVFGFEREVAVDFLSFERGKDLFTADYIQHIESGEGEHTVIADVYEAAQDFLDYMVFAWMKAMDERGISAARSIAKLATWMEILDRKDVADILRDNSLYYPYGRPALKKTCAVLGITYPDYL